MKSKVVIFGLDGATFEVLGPWIEQVDCLTSRR